MAVEDDSQNFQEGKVFEREDGLVGTKEPSWKELEDHSTEVEHEGEPFAVLVVADGVREDDRVLVQQQELVAADASVAE
jgi:hypothetical protein